MREYYEKIPAAAARYDALHAGRTEDVAFYVEEAGRCGGPILEVGCGTGRIALAIAETGIEVIGLERSSHMIARAAARRRAARPAVRRRIRLVLGDMREYAFRRVFAGVFLPFRVLQAMLTVEDQLAALARAREALSAEGRLVLDVFDPLYPVLASRVADAGRLEETGRAYDDEAGRQVIEKAVGWIDPVRQRLEQTWVYETRDAGGSVVERAFEPIRLRYYFRYEIEHLLARAGFQVEALYGGWQRMPFEEHGDDLVWIARPASRSSEEGATG